MSNNKYNNKFKNGYVATMFLLVVILMLAIMLFGIFVIYVQCDYNILNVKKDLFYITQNAYISLDNMELGYNYYLLNEEVLAEKIEKVINLNYPKLDIRVNKLQYNNGYVNIVLNIQMHPIILKNMLGDINFEIKDKIKVKLMEVVA